MVEIKVVTGAGEVEKEELEELVVFVLQALIQSSVRCYVII